MGELRVLGEKAVPRMNGVRTTAFRRLDNLLDIQIGLGSGSRAQKVGFIRLAHVKSGAVRLGIDGDGRDAHLAASPDDPHGNLTPVSDKNFFKHCSLLTSKAKGLRPVL